MISSRSGNYRSLIKYCWLLAVAFQFIQYLACRGGLEISDKFYALEILSFIFLTLRSAKYARRGYSSILFLFSASFYLFICGRFIALLIGFEADEGVFDLNWMASFRADEAARVSAFLYLSTFVCLLNFSYLSARFDAPRDDCSKSTNVWLILFFMVVFGSIQIVNGLGTVASALKGGYESIYASQAGEYAAGRATLSILFYVSISLAFTTNVRWIQRGAIALLLVSSIMTLVAGARGGFVSVLMLMIWLYGRKREVNVKKILIAFLTIGISLEIVMQFSARASGHSDLNILDIPAYFIYSQGVSLGVFSFSQSISELPLAAYMQSLFPGVLFVLSGISGSVNLHEANFQNYISWIADPIKYQAGFGLGWTLLSDIYVYSFGIFPIFAVFSLMCGLGIRWLDDNEMRSKLWHAVCIGLLMKIFMLPRSSISTVISFLVYFFILYVVVSFLRRR
ncbi:O-antigen polysaccharide polymerase Wzy [Paraburkholderia tropica]|uniref:O-antigen polysaccharide polymerase Wzy n=1 Tax=Paraburkholderia tropica TaxID=92647 RepID=UPI0031DF691B